MKEKTSRSQPPRRRKATQQGAGSRGLDQLRDQHDLLSGIIETSPVAIVSMNRDGEIVFANTTAEDLLGVSRREATERTYNDPEWRITDYDGKPVPEDELLFERVKVGLEPVRDVRHAIEWPDGRRVLLSLNAAPILSAEGEFEGMVATFEDLTERRHFEETLAESEHLVSAVLRSAPFGAHLYKLEDDGRLVFTGTNPAASRILGVNCSRFVGLTIEEAFPALRDTEIPAAFRRAAADGTEYQTDEIVYDAEGIAGAYEVHAFQTGPGRMAAFFGDVTQRKRAAEALRESDERFRRMAENIPDVLFRSSFVPDFRVEYVSPAVKELSGYSPEEIYADPDLLSRIVHTEDRERRARVVRSESPPSGVFRWHHRDGHTIWTEMRAVPVYDDEGTVIGLEGMYRDITERTLAEQAQRESEQRFRRLVDNAPDVIFRIKLKPEIEFEYVSPVVEEIGGYTPEELYADPGLLWSVVEPEDVEKIERILQSSSPSTEIVRWRHKDGRTYWTDAHHVPILDERGELVAIEGILRDITGKKLAEEERELLHAQLLRAQKMEAIGRLAGGVAHNFNNLLTGIIGYTELALMRLPENTPAGGDLEEIKRAAARASDVVRGLLAFARREPAHADALDLNSIVSELEALLKQLIGADIEIETRLAPELAPVEIDRSQIEQAIVNLVVNARDAMPGGGRLAIETAAQELVDALVERDVSIAPGRYVTLSITDTGIGMKEETIAHIFEPFFSTKGTTGTGLGLSTVFGVVEEAGGEIVVESRPGAGSTFTLFFPEYDERR